MFKRSTTRNGVYFETYELNPHQFERAVTLYSSDIKNSHDDSIEDASLFVNEWIDEKTLDKKYREWLKKMVNKGAEIYTYKEGWQPISEIAVW